MRTAGTWSAPIAIPGSGSSGSAFEDEWNFDPIAVDGGNRTAGHALSSLIGEDLAGTSRWR